jgi:transcriptional regulator with XRE-family HTH domain
VIHQDFLELSCYLNAARLEKNLTQKELADALGYSSPQFVSNWERGVAVPPLKRTRQLIRLLGLSTTKYIDLFMVGSARRLSRGLRKS